VPRTDGDATSSEHKAASYRMYTTVTAMLHRANTKLLATGCTEL